MTAGRCDVMMTGAVCGVMTELSCCVHLLGDTGGQPAMRHPGGRANISRGDQRAMRYPGDNTSISSPITDPITKQLPEKIWHPECGMCGLYLSIVYYLSSTGQQCRVRTNCVEVLVLT